MTRYRVVVADEILKAANPPWKSIEGLRLITTERSTFPNTKICVFEDDDAPVSLEGKLVELVLWEGDDGKAEIHSRELIQ